MSNGDRDEGKPGRVRIEKYEREKEKVDERGREELCVFNLERCDP